MVSNHGAQGLRAMIFSSIIHTAASRAGCRAMVLREEPHHDADAQIAPPHFGLSFALGKEYTAPMQKLTLPVILEIDEDGYFVSCPALQGCYSQGDTYEEAMANIKDAMRLHIEDRMESNPSIPRRQNSPPKTPEKHHARR